MQKMLMEDIGLEQACTQLTWLFLSSNPIRPETSMRLIEDARMSSTPMVFILSFLYYHYHFWQHVTFIVFCSNAPKFDLNEVQLDDSASNSSDNLETCHSTARSLHIFGIYFDISPGFHTEEAKQQVTK
ncbi:hypothetical protein S83_050469 [Arachis hypogaea]|nr:uncharacterized protein DS421_15g493970 [Arachis hypogaea]